jgi:excisionase family DNA binding protein
MSGNLQKKEQLAVERATYTIREVAALLGLGATSAYEKARRGELPVQPIRVGARYLFARRAVDELLGIKHIDTEESD